MAEEKKAAAVSQNAADKKEQNMMNISASPHIRGGQTTTFIMWDVIVALMPASVIGIYNFGYRAALMILICVTGCVVSEYLTELLLKRKNTIRDLSAVVTGLLIALNLPVELPYWMALLGCIFAIVVVKQLFGGIGQNFMNPALAGRVFLVMSFAVPMTRFTIDAVTTATPLMVLRSDGVNAVDIWDMFVGNSAGTIGETSALALLVGALYLIIKRVIRVTIPLTYIGSFALCIVIYGLTQDMGFEELMRFTAAHICGGGLMLGACFMATDYVTSPITEKGKVIFGILLGGLTFCFRIWGSSTEGVSYAIIIGNLLVPMIEMITKPKPFGKGYEKKSISENRGWLEPVELDEEGKPVKNKKKKEGPLRILVAICCIALLSGALLGGIFALTEKPIAETAERKKQESYKAVMPDADSYEEYTEVDGLNTMLEDAGYTGVTLDSSVNALKGSDTAGRIYIITSHEGYAGDIKMAVGIKDGEVTGVNMLSIGETTGLGMEARDNPSFAAQYVGKKNTLEVVKTTPESDDEIHAITGATITSKAVTNAVNAVIYLDSAGELPE